MDDIIKEIIIRCYREVLGRSPDLRGMNNYLRQLKDGTVRDDEHLKSILLSSPEYKQHFVVPIKEPPKKVLQSKEIAVVKNSHHQNILAKQIGADIVPYLYEEMVKYKTLIYMGMYDSSYLSFLFEVKKNHPKINIILWWIGSDVWHALKNPNYDIEAVKNLGDKHFCVSSGLKKELESIGIDAEELCLVPYGEFPLCSLPEDYTVGIYMASETEFYNYRKIEEIISKTPNTKYIIYGNNVELGISKYSNVEVCGWVEDTKKILERCSCILRLTKHDGFPKSIIEAMMMGRFIITNHHFRYVSVLDDIKNIVDLIKTHPVNPHYMSNWYRKNYSSDIIRKRLSSANVVLPREYGENNGVATHIEIMKKYSDLSFEDGKGVIGKIVNTHAEGLRNEPTIDVYTAHSYYTSEDYPILNGNNEVLANAQKAKRIICVSKYVKDFLVKNNIDESKMTVIGNSVDLEEIDKVKEFIDKRIDKKYSLFIGNEKVKRPALFVKLAKIFPKDMFVVIGCEGLKMPKNVIRFDSMERKDVLKLIKGCSIFLCLSKRESCPYVLLESMAMEKTCIASNYAGQKEIIIDGKNGYLFEPDNIRYLSKIYKKAKRKNVGKEARKHIEKYFDAQLEVPKMDSIFNPPKVSVLTFVYCTKENKRLEMLKECIESVRKQNFPSYEHIIIDDGSLIDLRKEIKEMNNTHLKYYFKEHTGIINSTEPLNYGLKVAQGEYLIILASDDLQLWTLFPLSESLDNHPEWIGVVGTHMRDDNMVYGHNSKMPIVDQLLYGNCINGNSIMFRRSVLKKIDLPPNDVGFAADYDLWVRISEVGKIERVNIVASLYRTHPKATRFETRKDMGKRKRILKHIVELAKERRTLIK